MNFEYISLKCNKTDICKCIDVTNYNICIQMGSRSLLQQTVPVVTLRLDLEKKDFSESLFLQINPLNLVHIKDTLEAALKQNQSQWIRKIRRKLK